MTTRPLNVVVVTFDAARADRFGCYGYGRSTTPHVDGFARDALLFEQMIAPSPWTVPSHASFFTGLYPQEHGADYPVPILAPGATTLAAHLGTCGYTSVLVSNNLLVGQSSGLAQGVSRVLSRRELYPRRRAPWRRWVGNVLGTLDSGAAATNRTIGAVLPHLPEPFFLFINYMECHWKYLPPRRFERRFARPRYSFLRSLRRRLAFRGRFSWEAVLLREAGDPEVLSDLYDAELACADEAFGQVLALLQRTGVEERTVVVLMADHGEMLGEHGMSGHGMALWQPLLHVPFLARIPGRPGARVPGLVQLNDVFAGLCGVLDLPVPEALRERPFGRDPFGQAAANGGREFAFARWQQWPEERIRRRQRRNPRVDFTQWPTAEAVTDGRFKLIATAQGEERLFDLAGDRAEAVDLRARSPEQYRRLRRALDQWRDACRPETARVFTAQEEQAITDRLAQLGYL
jgi:arylsulfatase A-like enzyme